MDAPSGLAPVISQLCVCNLLSTCRCLKPSWRSCRSLCSLVCFEFPKTSYHLSRGSPALVSILYFWVVFTPAANVTHSFHKFPIEWFCNVSMRGLHMMKHIPHSSSTGPSFGFEDYFIVFFHLTRPHVLIARQFSICFGSSIFERTWWWHSSCVSKHCLQCSADTLSIWVICDWASLHLRKASASMI